MRRRLLKNISALLSLSLTSISKSPASGSFTITVYNNGKILKDSNVSLSYTGKIKNTTTYDASTGVITCYYDRNQLGGVTTSVLTVNYKNSSALCTLTQQADYLVSEDVYCTDAEIISFGGGLTELTEGTTYTNRPVWYQGGSGNTDVELRNIPTSGTAVFSYYTTYRYASGYGYSGATEHETRSFDQFTIRLELEVTNTTIKINKIKELHVRSAGNNRYGYDRMFDNMSLTSETYTTDDTNNSSGVIDFSGSTSRGNIMYFISGSLGVSGRVRNPSYDNRAYFGIKVNPLWSN